MKFLKSAAYLSPLFLLFGAACGGDAQSITAQTIGPGEHCAEGGVHLVIDGEDYYVCDGTDGEPGAGGEDGEDGDPGQDGESSEITTSWLEAGEDGNTCPAEALEITVTTPGQSPVTELVCQAESDELSPFGLYIEQLINAELGFATASCICSFDDLGYATQEECEADRGAPYSLVRYILWCQDTAYKVYDREAPDGVLDFFSCSDIALDGFDACIDIFDSGNACSEDDEDDYEDCVQPISDAFEGCITALEGDEESGEWLSDFADFAELLCDQSVF